MKVSNNIPHAAQNAETAKSGKLGTTDALGDAKKTKSTVLGGPEAAASARVDLSSRAQDAKKAKALATPSDSIDEAKVARLQKMIDEGKYKVDAEAIADRLLDEHSKLP